MAARIGAVLEGQRALERRRRPRRGAPAPPRRPPSREAPACGRTGRDQRDLVAHRVEHHHHGRPDQDGVRHAERVRVRRRQALHQPHHVVAEIAEQPGRHRRQVVARAADALSAMSARRLSSGGPSSARTRSGRRQRLPVDRGDAVLAAPDQVGVEADHRVAAAHRAALDGFEQERGARRGRARSFRKAATGVSRSPTRVARTTPASPAA